MTAADKLARKLGSLELAEMLVEAGFENPTSIRNATNQELFAAVGSRENVEAVRAVFLENE